MKRKLIAAFALCALVLSGCSGSKPSVSTAPDTPKNDGTYTLEEIRTNDSIEKILQDHAVFTCSTGIYAAADSDAPDFFSDDQFGMENGKMWMMSY